MNEDKKQAICSFDENGTAVVRSISLKRSGTDDRQSFFIDELVGMGTSVIVYRGHYDMAGRAHRCIIKELYPADCGAVRAGDGVGLTVSEKEKYEEYKSRYTEAYSIQLQAQSGSMFEDRTVTETDDEGKASQTTVYDKENLRLNRSISSPLGIFESDSGTLYTAYGSNIGYPYNAYPPPGQKETIKESIRFALEAARILAAFHKKGWLILDIKEENFIVTGTEESAGIMFVDFGSIVEKEKLKQSDGSYKLSFTDTGAEGLPRELRNLLRFAGKDRRDKVREYHRILGQSGNSTDMYLLAAMLYRKLFGRQAEEVLTLPDPEHFDQRAFYDVLAMFFSKTLVQFASKRCSDEEAVSLLEKLLVLADTVDEESRQIYAKNGLFTFYTGVTVSHLISCSQSYHDKLGRGEKFAQLEKIVEKFDTQVRLIDSNNEEISAERIFEESTGPIFLQGSGGMGKSTLLYDHWGRLLEKREKICFYVDLSRYDSVHTGVKEGLTLANGRKDLPIDILAYILNNILREDMAELSAHISDNDQAASLLRLFCENTEQPEYIIMLDGYNEVLDPLRLSRLNDEIAMMISGEAPWKNVQVVLTGRKLPGEQDNNGSCDLRKLLDEHFDVYTFSGVMDSDIKAALKQYMKLGDGRIERLQRDKLWEVLKTPMFLNMYLEINDAEKPIHTRGEILDEYIGSRELRTGSRISRENNDSAHALLRRFIVGFALPAAASLMDAERSFYLDEDSFFDEMRSGFDLFLKNEQVFSRYTFSCCRDYAHIQDINFRQLLAAFSDVGNETGYFYLSDRSSVGFSHEYIRDYFASRHIFNVLSAAKAQGEKIRTFDNKKQLDFISENGIDYVWSDDISALLGELAGDYKNDPEYNEI